MTRAAKMCGDQTNLDSAEVKPHFALGIDGIITDAVDRFSPAGAALLD